MTENTEQARKTPKQAATLERGINLDVLGRAIIAQADERIRWHKRSAGVMGAELNAMTMKPGAPASSAEDWQRARAGRTFRAKSTVTSNTRGSSPSSGRTSSAIAATGWA